VSPAKLVVDAPLAHLCWGRGPRRVLLLHGVGGGRESWGDAMSGTGRALARAGYCAIAPDLPGYGDSPAVEPYDLHRIALAVAALIDWLGPEPVAVVGHSMGGMVALELVARAPQRVTALVLMATTPAFGRLDGAWQTEFLALRLAPLDAGQGMLGLAPGLVRGLAALDARQDAVARATILMSSVPENTYRKALAAIVGFDRRALLGAVQQPVLCLAGSEDRNAPPAVMQQMASRFPDAEFRALPGVGHLCHMEAPQAVNPVLVDFFQRRIA
jgi:3-oxoadipate enol-lactonase